MAAKKKNGTEKPPPVDRLILPAIGIGLALLAYQFFSGIKNEVSIPNQKRVVSGIESHADCDAASRCLE